MALPALAAAARQAVTFAANDPRVKKTFNKYVSMATNGKFSSLGLNDVKTSVNQAIAVAAARRAGVPAQNIWAGIDTVRMSIAERRIYDQTLNAFNASQQQLDDKFAIQQPRDVTRDLMDREMIRWANSHFGSQAGLRRAHAQLRAFLATDSDDIESLIKVHLN